MFFYKQKTAYEMRISVWSSDVCSSDLRDHRGKARQQIADRCGETRPALKAAPGNARIDERQRCAPVVSGGDEVRPEFGFDPDAEIGTPMLKKPGAIIGVIERRILVKRARRQTLGHQSRRCHSAGGDE